jgi:hypothetical protein
MRIPVERYGSNTEIEKASLVEGVAGRSTTGEGKSKSISARPAVQGPHSRAEQ